MNYTYDDYMENDTAVYNAINEACELWQSMTKEAQKYKRLQEITHRDYINTIKKVAQMTMMHSMVRMGFLNSAIQWVSMRNSCDKRKKYPEKNNYDALVAYINKTLNVSVTDIINIQQCGYDAYGYNIIFYIDNCDYVFELFIPNVSKLTVENSIDMYYGKSAIGYYSSTSSVIVVKSTYDEKELADGIITITTNDKFSKHQTVEDYFKRKNILKADR